MICAFCGSHSTGKSTLLEYFKGREGYVCVDSVTRTTTTDQERRIDGVEDLNDVQLRMCDNICKANDTILKTYSNSSDIVLLDRCIFDFKAYTECFYNRGLVSKETYDMVCERVMPYLKGLDIVFYLAPEFGIVDDGVRSLDENLRKDVDKVILDTILWHKVRAVKLEGSVKQRLEKIKMYIDLYKRES